MLVETTCSAKQQIPDKRQVVLSYASRFLVNESNSATGRLKVVTLCAGNNTTGFAVNVYSIASAQSSSKHDCIAQLVANHLCLG